jgi:hypothetical protein
MVVPHSYRLCLAGALIFFTIVRSSLANAHEYPFDWGTHERGHGRHPYEIGPPIIYLPPPGRFRTPERSPYDFTAKAAGRLQVTVHPEDATVFVDGERIARNEDDEFDLGLLAGKHTVRVVKGGYRPRTVRVQVEEAQVTMVSVRLKRQRGREP